MAGFQVIHHNSEHTPIINGKTSQQRWIEAHKCAQKYGDDEYQVGPLSATDWFHRQVSPEEYSVIVIA